MIHALYRNRGRNGNGSRIEIEGTALPVLVADESQREAGTWAAVRETVTADGVLIGIDLRPEIGQRAPIIVFPRSLVVAHGERIRQTAAREATGDGEATGVTMDDISILCESIALLPLLLST